MEILILLLLMGVNGVLAMSEIAVVAARRIRLEQSAARGHSGAQAALALVLAPTRFLSTVQVGITMIGIIAGAFSQATIADDLAGVLRRVPHLPPPYANALATVLVIMAVTYLSLVIGELVPKRVALHDPERVAALLARPMSALARLASPAVHLLSLSTDLASRLFQDRMGPRQPITEDEIRALIRLGTATGVFDQKEQELVDRIFRLADQTVNSLMVPRSDVDWLEADYSIKRIRVAVATSPHSHFPVCRGGLENLVGVVHVKDLVKHGLITDTIDLAALARPALFVPESMPVLRVLEQLKTARTHVAFILDEYGVVQGLITLNDVVEGLLGQIIRQGEPVELRVVQRADGSWLFDGMLSLEELKELLKTEELPAESEGRFHTIGGLMMAVLGRIPKEGDYFDWQGWRFEIVDMDRHRVDKVLVWHGPGGALPAEAPEGPGSMAPNP